MYVCMYVCINCIQKTIPCLTLDYMITIHYPASVKECWAHLGDGYYLPEMDEIPTSRKLPALSTAWRPRSWGVNIFFSAIIPPSVLCVYIYIYNYIYICTVYDIYKRSMEVISGLQTTLRRFFLQKNPTDSLHASSSQIAMRASLWRAVGHPSSSPELIWRDFSSSETPKPPHTIHTEPAPFSCRFRDHGKVNQNSRFTTRFSPARATDPPTILKSFACTSANSPQQKPKDDSRTITSETRKGRLGMEKNGWVVFCSKGRLFQRRAHPYNTLQPWPKVSKNLMQNFFVHLKKPQKNTSVASCSRKKT